MNITPDSSSQDNIIDESIFVFTSSAGGGGAERVASDVYHSIPFASKKWITLCENQDGSNYSTPDIVLGKHYFRLIPKFLNDLFQLSIWTVKYIRCLKKYCPNVSWSLCSAENIINLLACACVRDTKCITSIRGNPLNSYLPVFNKILYNIIFQL